MISKFLENQIIQVIPKEYCIFGMNKSISILFYSIIWAHIAKSMEMSESPELRKVVCWPPCCSSGLSHAGFPTCVEGNHVGHQFVKGQVPIQLTSCCAAAALMGKMANSVSHKHTHTRRWSPAGTVPGWILAGVRAGSCRPGAGSACS